MNAVRFVILILVQLLSLAGLLAVLGYGLMKYGGGDLPSEKEWRIASEMARKREECSK
jgi:hypothetical protein